MSVTPRTRILIVEDDDAMSRLLKTLLELSGYEVHVEGSGSAGLHHAAEEQPHLVILDLRLPDINGYEVCRKLRQFSNSWSMPILMLTGLDKPADQLRGFAFGADAYLTKPCDPPELLKTVSLLLGQTVVPGDPSV